MHITRISGINNFTSNYKTIFRDEELFDEHSDIVQSGYSTYDGYNVSYRELLDEAIDYYYPNIDNSRIVKKRELISYIDRYGQVETPICSLDIENNGEIYDLCFLENDGRRKFSGNLYNHLINKTNRYSIEQIKTVAQASKLLKADSKEYVDYNLLEAGFYFIKKFTKPSNEDIEDLINALVAKDEKGNEICVMSAYALVRNSANVSIKKCIQAVEAGMKCNDDGVYQKFDLVDAYGKLYSKY